MSIDRACGDLRDTGPDGDSLRSGRTTSAAIGRVGLARPVVPSTPSPRRSSDSPVARRRKLHSESSVTSEPKKACFFNAERPCDLTCKAAFEVDDPVDNIDCYFIWLSYHAGETLYEIKRLVEGFRGGPPDMGGSPSGGPFSGKGPFPGFGPKGPKPSNN
jgi:hypothetical protein